MANAGSAYGRFMKRTFSHPMVERFQTRRVRRLVVLAMVANTALIVGLPLLTGIDWLGIPFFLAIFPLASMLNMSVRGVTEIPLSSLDELQAQLRLRSFSMAYYPAIGFALLAGIFGPQLIEPLPAEVVACIAGVAGATLLGLPAMLLAWRLPDEDAPDEDGVVVDDH